VIPKMKNGRPLHKPKNTKKRQPLILFLDALGEKGTEIETY